MELYDGYKVYAPIRDNDTPILTTKEIVSIHKKWVEEWHEHKSRKFMEMVKEMEYKPEEVKE